MKILKSCLEEFVDASGLKASNYKSNAYIAGVPKEAHDQMLNFLQFHKGTFPFKFRFTILGSCPAGYNSIDAVRPLPPALSLAQLSTYSL